MDSSASEPEASELLAAAADGAAPELARRLMLQAAGADLKDDPLSAMLAVQAAAVHEAALGLLRRAGDCADESGTGALYARQAARLLHLFVRQAKTLAQRRENARLEAKAAEFERRDEAELQRRRELEERRWDPEFEDDEFEEDEFAEDEFEEDDSGEDDLGDDDPGADDDARPRVAVAAERDPAAPGAPAPADIAETADRLSALFARHAAAQRARAEAAVGRSGTAGDAAEDGGYGEGGNGTGPP